MAKKPAAKKSKNRSQQAASAKPARKSGELSRFQKGVIIVFIAVFALSTLASALASVVQSQQSTTVEYNVDYIDSVYEDSVAELEATVAENPEDAESLLSLADSLSTWGSYASLLAANDEETSHANELLGRAISYYDQYLALEDSDEAATSRAMCYYYQEDTTSAINALEELTAESDYAPAWYNLGIIYEAQGNTEDALAAYGRAAELDPDDEAGVKSSAESRISSIEGTDEEAETSDGSADSSDADASSEDGAAADGSSDATTETTDATDGE